MKKLVAKEKKQVKKKKKTTLLVGDGLPHLLTGDEFYEMAKGKEQETEAARQREARKDGRAGDGKVDCGRAGMKGCQGPCQCNTDLKPKFQVQPVALVRPKLKIFWRVGVMKRLQMMQMMMKRGLMERRVRALRVRHRAPHGIMASSILGVYHMYHSTIIVICRPCPQNFSPLVQFLLNFFQITCRL